MGRGGCYIYIMTRTNNKTNTETEGQTMTYIAHNTETNETLATTDPDAALAHIGAHCHVTGTNGHSAAPMDLWGGKVNVVVFWATLTGQVRHRIATGRPQGTIKGTITRKAS